MRDRWQRVLSPLIGVILFVVALEVLRHELHAVSWPALRASVLGTAQSHLLAALFLTVVNYVALSGYDFLAFRYIGKSLAWWRIAIASFLAYAIANNVGFAMLSGTSVRYRFYTRWGVSGEDLSRIVFSATTTLWLGLLGLGGLSLTVSPLPRAVWPNAAGLIVASGWLLITLVLAYLVLTTVRREPLRIWRFQLPMPTPGIAVAQLLISAVDWILAAAVFYVLLPSSSATFLTVLGAFLAAQLIGIVSTVPGGVGVFESLIVLLLKPFLTPGELLPALIVYRAVYYLLPLCVALIGLLIDELGQRKTAALRATKYLGWLSEQLTPRVLAIFAFLGGLLLLFSGATPAAENRLRTLGDLLPIGVIETSHFIGSLVGACLLLLSQGLARRLDAAYHFTTLALCVGIAASLLKGGDYEEALLLTFLLLALLRARPAFDRKAALLETRFSPAWIIAVVAALASSVWLGMFAFKHVEYSRDLWWQFELEAQASRFLRASVGTAIVVLLFALARLIGHAPHEVELPSDAELAAVKPAIEAQRSTFPYLVYLRDKAILFNAEHTGFMMYAVQGRSWVALGDPTGPPGCAPDLIRQFLEKCDDYGGTPVFYEVRKGQLHHYADFGLTFVKLGEEAKVNLQQFTMEGGQASRFRQTVRRLEKDGGTFRIVPAEQVSAITPQLQTVSDDWLEQKAGAEKGFSLGFFDPRYLERFPVAVIEHAGSIQAFANLWPGPQKEELSIDLLRYHRNAPKGVMEALLVHLLIWGKSENYRWFGLGMAPMSGFEQSPIAPLWMRLGNLLYEHGEVLYNFQGLRAFKDKFDPVWEPQYLAYPGGLSLPRILANVAALVAGGYRRIFLR